MKRTEAQSERLEVSEAAASWFSRRRDGLPPSEEAKYQEWLAEDPKRKSAMADLEASWEAVSFPFAVGRAAEAAQMLDARVARRRHWRYSFAAVGFAAAAVALITFVPRSLPVQSPRTFVIRPNIEVLPDGSTAELNSSAEIGIDYTAEKRAVRLVRGEALFAVKKNAARPFIVSAGGIEVKAVGTAFSVRFDAKQVGVLVTEGKVAIERVASTDSAGTSGAPESSPIFVAAGGEIALGINRQLSNAPSIKPLTSEEISAALAWRGKRMEFTRMPLSEAVKLFNRQNEIQLSVADTATGSMPISGIFWADDPESFARLLESGLGVRAERSNDIIFLRAR